MKKTWNINWGILMVQRGTLTGYDYEWEQWGYQQKHGDLVDISVNFHGI